jgi:molybdopterin converting factor small subunit
VEVQVRLYANLADYGPSVARGGVARVELRDGATLGDLLDQLRIPDEVPPLLFVNGRDAHPTTRLSAGDIVDVLPPLAGG